MNLQICTCKKFSSVIKTGQTSQVKQIIVKIVVEAFNTDRLQLKVLLLQHVDFTG